MSKVRALARRLRRNCSGVAMTELALALPLLTVAGLYGTEVANFALVNMRIHDAAIQVADNASRIGDTSTLQNRQIYESDIDDLLRGAGIHTGDLDLYGRGRVIVSSIEIWNQANHCDSTGYCKVGIKSAGTQFVHWQRCKGTLSRNSAYSENMTVPSGVGPAGQQVSATVDTPVIYVEVFYQYQPLVSSRFIGTPLITSTAAFGVRDDRDLFDVYKRSSSDPVDSCAIYNAYS